MTRCRSTRSAPAAHAPSLAHGLPVRFAWLTIGLLFFFPGAWKLHGGAAWLDALPAVVEWKRFQLGLSLPSPWSSSLVKLGGALTIALELGVGVLLLFRKTRLVGVGAMLTFHLAVQAVMGIGFSSLWACYLVFGDWARWLGREEGPATPRRSALPGLVVGLALLLAMLVTGVLGREDTWPVACYPTFRHPAPRVVRWVEIDEPDAHLDLAALRGGGGQRWWGLSAKVAASPTREGLEALHHQWRGEVRTARYFVVTWSPGDAEVRRVELR